MARFPRHNIRMNYSLFGAALDTGNLGVSALSYSLLYHFSRDLQKPVSITVFDYSKGRTTINLSFLKNREFFYRQGAFLTRRLYKKESLASALLLGRFGGFGNPIVSQIKNSDAVLDISGGDSFTDLYGNWRFRSITIPKLLAIRLKKSLILLPQTYGPFRVRSNRDLAAEIVRSAKLAMARDKRSYEELKDLLGVDFDPALHKCGVDVAFALPAIKPIGMGHALADFIKQGKEKLIGLNISGLLYNDSVSAKVQFGLRVDYKKIINDFVTYILNDTDFKILLIPHVCVDEKNKESDLRASKDVLSTADFPERIMVGPEYKDPCEAKWLISQVEWFCGTRMHSTIAALSSATPVAAISYSPKTVGVFECCGLGNHVADPVRQNEAEVMLCLIESLNNRSDVRSKYVDVLPRVLTQAREQFREML